jgi:quercetin dioxygenase-like cupin family protein
VKSFLKRRGFMEAEVLLPSRDIAGDHAFFTETLGFRLEAIYPADDPAVAVMSGHGVRFRLERIEGAEPGTILLSCEDPGRIAGGRMSLTAPGGTRIDLTALEKDLNIPSAKPLFSICKLMENSPWVIGRAGMHYRDLIPDRLGGSIIASHVRIPVGGPVPDIVHYHKVRFQLIYCYRGWVKVVYEDQGPPFVLQAGDCVTQPPQIRHRVLEASDQLEVIEIGVPAEHLTVIDHEMSLPTPVVNAGREFDGQTFCRHIAQGAIWEPWRLPGFEACDTGVAGASDRAASVSVVRRLSNQDGNAVSKHSGGFQFSFVLAGSLSLEGPGGVRQNLTAGDAFVIPPDVPVGYSAASADLKFLEVAIQSSD